VRFRTAITSIQTSSWLNPAPRVGLSDRAAFSNSQGRRYVKSAFQTLLFFQNSEAVGYPQDRDVASICYGSEPVWHSVVDEMWVSLPTYCWRLWQIGHSLPLPVILSGRATFNINIKTTNEGSSDPEPAAHDRFY